MIASSSAAIGQRVVRAQNQPNKGLSPDNSMTNQPEAGQTTQAFDPEHPSIPAAVYSYV